MATTTMQVSQVAGKVGSQVGRSLPRLEAREKVTGRAEYTHTMRLPGMLSREYRLEHDRFHPCAFSKLHPLEEFW
jgi:hypothetical protein